jgi:transglutaminase-like putative cysteine protease
MSEAPPNDRLAGWALAGVLFLHLILLRESSGLVFAAFLLLGAGALLRSRQIFAPAWLERTLVLLGAVTVFVLHQGLRPSLFIGELGGLTGAIFLLRPLTPLRGLRVILCALATLLGTVMRSNPSVGSIFIVLDVVVLMVLAQQIYRPPEAVRSFWTSLVRSLRVVVPVSIVVILVFWLFPDYSLQPIHGLTGFAGNGVLDPGRLEGLSQSRRVALVAQFSESEQLPSPGQLYWRGQVLENNEGLRWTRAPSRSDSARSLEAAPPPQDATVWSYSQDYLSNRGTTLPVLDRVLTVEATRGGQEIAVLELGAGVLSAVGAGSLQMKVTAADDPASDAPEPGIDGGALGLPAAVRDHPALPKVAARVLSPTRSTGENLQSMARYFRQSGFTYSMRPGKMSDLGKFIMTTRRGFCEHYAAAAANLLRLGGIPARVVIGFRGGDWNPWLRTITVRDANAHAWVEAWDGNSGKWLRFDPTLYVAPNLTDRMERNFNSDEWPWYRMAGAFVVAFFTEIGDHVGRLIEAAGGSELWETLRPVFFTGLLLLLTAWLARRLILRHLKNSRDVAAGLLADLDRHATRLGLQRRTGETPLAWLSRLQRGGGAEERTALECFASAYHQGVYSASGLTPAAAGNLRASARQLKKIWKARRRQTVGIAS